jgi:hypothetical protein
MGVGQMVDFFAAAGMPGDPTKITREHVETFLAASLPIMPPVRSKPGTSA